MQPSIKNDLVYLLLILESIGKIQLYSKEFSTATDFFQANKQMNFDACLLLISNIGEQSNKISSELKNKNGSIEWKKIKAMRNRIAHDYTGIDFEKVFEIVKNELPNLKFQIQSIIKIEISNGNFLLEELNVAKASSTYYIHVDFGNIL